MGKGGKGKAGGPGPKNSNAFRPIPVLHPKSTWSTPLPEADRDKTASELLSTSSAQILGPTLAAQYRGLLYRPDLCPRKVSIQDTSADTNEPVWPVRLAWKFTEGLKPAQLVALENLVRELDKVGGLSNDETPTTINLRHERELSVVSKSEEQRTAISNLSQGWFNIVCPTLFSVFDIDWSELHAKAEKLGLTYKYLKKLVTGSELTIMDGEDPDWQNTSDHHPLAYTTLTILGVPATIHFPTLGYSIPINPGDIIGFQASFLTWRLERSRDPEKVLVPMHVLMSWEPNTEGRKPFLGIVGEPVQVIKPLPAAQPASGGKKGKRSRGKSHTAQGKAAKRALESQSQSQSSSGPSSTRGSMTLDEENRVIAGLPTKPSSDAQDIARQLRDPSLPARPSGPPDHYTSEATSTSTSGAADAPVISPVSAPGRAHAPTRMSYDKNDGYDRYTGRITGTNNVPLGRQRWGGDVQTGMDVAGLTYDEVNTNTSVVSCLGVKDQHATTGRDGQNQSTRSVVDVTGITRDRDRDQDQDQDPKEEEDLIEVEVTGWSPRRPSLTVSHGSNPDPDSIPVPVALPNSNSNSIIDLTADNEPPTQRPTSSLPAASASDLSSDLSNAHQTDHRRPSSHTSTSTLTPVSTGLHPHPHSYPYPNDPAPPHADYHLHSRRPAPADNNTPITRSRERHQSQDQFVPLNPADLVQSVLRELNLPQGTETESQSQSQDLGQAQRPEDDAYRIKRRRTDPVFEEGAAGVEVEDVEMEMDEGLAMMAQWLIQAGY